MKQKRKRKALSKCEERKRFEIGMILVMTIITVAFVVWLWNMEVGSFAAIGKLSGIGLGLMGLISALQGIQETVDKDCGETE